jgi:hypothetical protein
LRDIVGLCLVVLCCILGHGVFGHGIWGIRMVFGGFWGQISIFGSCSGEHCFRLCVFLALCVSSGRVSRVVGV